MRFKELFVKSDNNPILTPSDWPYLIDHVFNPAATIYENKTILLVREEDRRGFSSLTTVSSEDGVTGWQIGSKPALTAESSNNEHAKGFEDARIVFVEELEEYIIACVSFRKERIDIPYGISLIGTKDFINFRRINKPLDPENKNASLFPRRIKDKFALIHRPVREGKSYLAVSFSDDLMSWEQELLLFSTRKWYWDEYKIGLACPPIETEQGWIIFYHGSQGKANRLIYRVGLALLDLEDLRLIKRSPEWVLGPTETYEGGNNGIVFPCGYTLDAKTQELKVYYGADDSNVCLAITNLQEILDYLKKCPNK